MPLKMKEVHKMEVQGQEQAIQQDVVNDAGQNDVAIENNSHEEVANAESENKENANPEKDEQITNDDEWPKKAVNALSRQKKENNKLRAEMRQMRSQYEQMHKQMQEFMGGGNNRKEDNSPKESDFESVLDYLKAQAAHESRKAAEEIIKSQQAKSFEDSRKAQTIAERESHLQSKSAEMAKKVPDYVEVMQENYDVLLSAPEHISEMIASMPDPALVTYNLLKSGEFENLYSMHPNLAAVKIMNSQSAPAIKKASQAPKPISGARGAGGGSGGKPITEMSGEELKKWVRS